MGGSTIKISYNKLLISQCLIHCFTTIVISSSLVTLLYMRSLTNNINTTILQPCPRLTLSHLAYIQHHLITYHPIVFNFNSYHLISYFVYNLTAE